MGNSQSPTEAYWNSSPAVLNGGMSSTSQYSGQSAQGSGLSSYTPQAVGNVMATGTASYASSSPGSLIASPNYVSGQTVQVGNDRYIIAGNQPQTGQFEGMYISGMSG